MGGGEYQDFPSKNFSLTVPKKFVGQPCCAVIRVFPVAKKFMDKRGGLSRFSVEKIFSHSAEYFVGQTFCAVFQKFSGSEKVYG